MANPDQDAVPAAPPDERLALSGAEGPELQRRVRGSSIPRSLEEAYQLAASMEPADQLRLMSRLWQSLPREHRAALLQFQLDEIERDAGSQTVGRQARTPLRRLSTSDAEVPRLYSAPRRFDLATIFVVTTAYALLFGGLRGFDAPPFLSVYIAGFITVIGAGQALLFGGARPRLASVVVGAVAFMLTIVILLQLNPRLNRGLGFILAIFSLPLGFLFGYIAGALVGGVFLVADVLRLRYNQNVEQDVESPTDTEATQNE